MLIARLIPAADRDAILGDLVEEAACRRLTGARRSLWLSIECGTIAAGLSLERARAWLVMPPVREVVSGMALEGRGLFRGEGASAAVIRAVIFVGSVATLVLGVEVLVGALMAASGF